MLFLVRLRSARTWTTTEQAARTSPIELPDLIWYSDVGAQAAIRVSASPARARERRAHSPQDPEHEFLARLRSVAEIERRVVLLASRVEYLGRFLGEISLPEIEAETQRVRAKEANATTAEARARYQLGVGQREAQLKEARPLEGRRDQLLATIDYMLATLEMLPLKLTRSSFCGSRRPNGRPDRSGGRCRAAVQRPRGDRGSLRGRPAQLTAASVGPLGAPGRRIVEQVDRPFGEQLAVHLRFDGAALVPRAEHVPADGTGSACEDQQRTHQLRSSFVGFSCSGDRPVSEIT